VFTTSAKIRGMRSKILHCKSSRRPANIENLGK